MERSAPCSAATLSLMRASCLRADQIETDRLTSIARSPSALWVIVMMAFPRRGIRARPGREPEGKWTEVGRRDGSGEGGAVVDRPAGKGRMVGEVGQARGG